MIVEGTCDQLKFSKPELILLSHRHASQITDRTLKNNLWIALRIRTSGGKKPEIRGVRESPKTKSSHV